MAPRLTQASYYYNYNFISPDPLFAEVKEEMKSYFITGVVDDTMFGLYTEKALKKLGRSSYKIDEVLLQPTDMQCRLPDDFSFVRELWAVLATDIFMSLPSSVYMAARHDCQIECEQEPVEHHPSGDCPPSFKVLKKSTGQLMLSFRHSHLLTPGNITVLSHLGTGCPNYTTTGPFTFDIRDHKIITSSPMAALHLVYYKKEFNEQDYQMIPDNYVIGEFVKAYIKYRMYEQIYNEVSDETFSQVERKYMNYKQEYLEAFIMADAEVKKQTIYQKLQSMKTASRNMRRYNIR